MVYPLSYIFTAEGHTYVWWCQWNVSG